MGEKKAKALPKVEKDNSYDWVDADVKIRASLFADKESVSEINIRKVVRPGFRIELLPCNRTDRMNCAPSQVHPNGWAFLKCFQNLMEYLEIEPEVELFFTLFQAKGVWKGVWINLNSTPGFSIFKLYKSSFKDFKEMFLKVKSVDEDFPFYLDEHLGEKFPMYWCCHPQHILGPDLITPRNECIVSFLMEMVDKGGLLSVSEFLLWEENKAAVINYLVGRYPGVSASSLRARFKAKNFEGPSSNAEKMEIGAEVNQPEPKKKGFVFKKRKSDAINIDDDETTKAIQLNELSNFTLKQERLHGFEEEGDGSSVWEKNFPFSVVVDEIVQASSDLGRIEGVGDVGIDQFIQVVGLRLASIGRAQEKKHKKMLRAATENIVVKEQLETKEKSLIELRKEIAAVKEELKLEKESHEKDVETLSKKEKELDNTSEQIVVLTLKLKKMESSREGEILDAFAEGFERAVTQAKFLLPDGDFTAMDPSKIVREGDLVDDEEVAEEDGDNLAE
ncbi:uncharacterized protein DS421_6g179550 [Arachis hypogaea]|nr:uncharacterized protein DS421_6g179550 [Arachis hypogaea]